MGTLLLPAFLPGCASDEWNPTSGLERGEPAVSAVQRPAAIVAGEAVPDRELLPILGELAGDTALREIALDRELALELGRRGITIDEAAIEQERDRLARTIGGDELGQELTREILEARRLGPHRLRALLMRNAGLRALIDAPAPPSEAALQVAYDVRHGAKRRVRVALFSSSREAARARLDIAANSETLGVIAAFAEIAAERSVDPSAATGGLLGAISTGDPGLPAMLRREITRAPLRELGDIVGLDDGFALVLVEADIEPSGTPFESVRDRLDAEIRERSSRLAMEALAQELIGRAEVTPVEPGLRWSWDRAQAGRSPAR